jgi:hypothetical protein
MRILAPLSIAASIVLIALTGCGGSGGEGSTTSPTETGSSTQRKLSQKQAAKSKPAGKIDNQSKPASSNPAVSGHDEGQPNTSHHDSGGGANQFKTQGGDNSIQESGSEAGNSEFVQAAAALHGYLDARAFGRWAEACAYLAPAVVTQLGQLAGSSKKIPCTKLLASLSAGLPPGALREAAVADVGTLRVDGDSAFLLFHGAHAVDYFVPMARDGDEWKVAAIAPSALP